MNDSVPGLHMLTMVVTGLAASLVSIAGWAGHARGRRRAE
jgi:hypothetical protein